LNEFGEVRASKLLARKRPQLIPIFDQVVGCVYGFNTSRGYWKWTHNILVTNDLEVVGQLSQIRGLASQQNPGIAEISMLRVLDVAVWMSHQFEHPTWRNQEKCPNPQPWGMG
jgi:hypothetical protein